MAGAGVRVFQAGEVLTAALVNTYLQDQVVARFASAAVRDAAFGAPGNLLQKPVLEEGRVCYLDSTSELQYYSGTAWVSISAEAVINQVQAKGDIVVGAGVNTISRVAVGANDTVLVADSTTPSGLAWRVATVPDNSITAGKIVDGTIVNADINASAAIDKTKISGTAVTLADTGTITSTMIAGGAITEAKLADNSVTSAKIAPGTVIAADIAAGTITATELADGAVTSGKILDGAIVNGDINASAAIALNKLATGTQGQVVIANSSGIPTYTAISGDIAVTNAGVASISSGVIVNADINASAAIDKTKISGTAITAADTGTITSTMIENDTIVNADIKSNAAIAYSKLNLATSITNSDIATSAAISLSKLASGTAAQVIVHSGSGVPTATTVTGDVTISSSGVTAISSDTIVNADINASAAIAYSKLNIANSVSTADLASGAPRAGFRSAQNPQTGTTYTLALSDLGALVELGNASPITLTVPLASSVAFAVGDRIDILQTGAGQVTVAGAGGVTLNAYDNQFKLNGQFAVATLIKRAANTWLLVGNITS